MIRYLKVYRKHIALLIVILILAYISSVTRGKAATVTAVAAGICMIFIAISFVLWIVKTPVKKDNNQIV